MRRCLIFCAGGFRGLARPVRPEDFLIAADGGLRHTEALGLVPEVILGDFDSLGFIPQNATVFPVEKDDTDAMLAIRRGLELGFREFDIYGGMDGPRLDHTIANLQALQFLADRGAAGYLIGAHSMATVIREETLRFPESATGNLSLFCLGPPAEGITLTGLKYSLENGTLTPGFPLGVSNHFAGQTATITVKSGNILAIWDRKAGFPERYS